MLTLPVKFSIFFAVLAFLLSFGVGFLVANRIGYVMIVSVGCTILGGVLGIATFRVLETRVPEILDLFRLEYESAEIAADELDEAAPEVESAYAVPEEPEEPVPSSDEAQVFGDHILVNKVKIKNEPKLIAKAIQTMLSRDS